MLSEPQVYDRQSSNNCLSPAKCLNLLSQNNFHIEMTRNKALEILNAFGPYLTDTGGIKQADTAQYERLYGIMKEYSIKLVSRCIYCKILMSTSPQVLEQFLKIGAWQLINSWIKTSKDDNNTSYLFDLLKLLEILPMNMERLRETECPKLVKKLCKHTNEEIAIKADTIIKKWTSIILSSSKDKEKKKSGSSGGKATENGKDTKTIGTVKQKLQQPKRKEPPKDGASENRSKEEKMSKKVKTSELDSATVVALNDADPYEAFPRDEIKNYMVHKSNTGEVKNRPSTVKVKQGKSRLDLFAASATASAATPKLAAAKAKKPDATKGVVGKQPQAETKKPLLPMARTANGQAFAPKPTPTTHYLKDSTSFMDALNVMPVVNKKRRKPLVANKDSSLVENVDDNINIAASSAATITDNATLHGVTVTATVAAAGVPAVVSSMQQQAAINSDTIVYNSSASNETSTPSSTSPAVVVPVSLGGLTNTERTTLGVSDVTTVVTGVTPSSVTVATVPLLSSVVGGTYNNSSATTTIQQQQSNDDSMEQTDVSANCASNSVNEEIIPPKVASPPRFSFYKDILEESTTTTTTTTPTSTTSAISSKNGSEDVNIISSSNNDDMTSQDTQSYSITEDGDTLMQDMSEQSTAGGEDVDDKTSPTQSGLTEQPSPESPSSPNQSSSTSVSDGGKRYKPILCYVKKGAKKNVRWVEDQKLEQVKYFELDETERTNVSRPAADMKRFDMKHEAQLLMEAKKVRCFSYAPWKLIPLDLPPPINERGCKSVERDIQAERQKTTLEAFFAHSLMPDTPREPELEFINNQEPIIIPLEDQEFTSSNDYSSISLVPGNHVNTMLNAPAAPPSGNYPNVPPPFQAAPVPDNSGYRPPPISSGPNYGPGTLPPGQGQYGQGPPPQSQAPPPPANIVNSNWQAGHLSGSGGGNFDVHRPPPPNNFVPPPQYGGQNSYINTGSPPGNYPPPPGGNPNRPPNHDYQSWPGQPNNMNSYPSGSGGSPPGRPMYQASGPPGPPPHHHQPPPNWAHHHNPNQVRPNIPIPPPPPGGGHVDPGPPMHMGNPSYWQDGPPGPPGPPPPGYNPRPWNGGHGGGPGHKPFNKRKKSKLTNDGLCRFWVKLGKCKFEDRCNYSHDVPAQAANR